MVNGVKLHVVGVYGATTYTVCLYGLTLSIFIILVYFIDFNVVLCIEDENYGVALIFLYLRLFSLTFTLLSFFIFLSSSFL